MARAKASDPQRADLMSEVGGLLIRLADHSREVYGTAVAGERLTELQWLLLRRLREEAEPPAISRLADWLGTERPTVTALVDRLEARGLVERRPDPDDRRVRRVAVTAEGEAAVRRIDVQASPHTPCHHLGYEDLCDLRDLLVRMLDADARLSAAPPAARAGTR